MSDFANMIAITPIVPPDAFKHTNYVQGMVLGVEDFIQEFVYLDGHGQWLVREAFGYGTVCGLEVSFQVDANGPQIYVQPGTAINPRGQLMRVPETQCARLNDWLKDTGNRTELLKRFPTPSKITLYVALCYRTCNTDDVPIPGEPCRSEDETRQPSRVQDNYRLQLSFVKPVQKQEDYIHDFVGSLRKIKVANIADSPELLSRFEAAVRAFTPQSPTPPADNVVIPAGSACAYLSRAFQIWTLELRSKALGTNQSCAGDPPDDDCVLLAELNVSLTAALQVVSGPSNVDVIQDGRPTLLPLRLLQEWLLCGFPMGGDVTGPSDKSTVVALRSKSIAEAGPNAGDVLVFTADQWTPTPPSALPGSGAPIQLDGEVRGASNATFVKQLYGKDLLIGPPGLVDDQVITLVSGKWVPVTPTPPPSSSIQLDGEVGGPGNATQVKQLYGKDLVAPDAPPGLASGQVLTYDGTHWKPIIPTPVVPQPALSGDVATAGAVATVQGIQGNKVDATAPANGQVLVFSGGQWTPTAVPLPVASGRFAADGGTVYSSNGLSAIQFADPVLYLLVFPAFDAKGEYVVTGSPISDIASKAPQCFEIIDNTPQGGNFPQSGAYDAAKDLIDKFIAAPGNKDFVNLFANNPNNAGILVRMMPAQNGAVPKGFLVEISRLGN